MFHGHSFINGKGQESQFLLWVSEQNLPYAFWLARCRHQGAKIRTFTPDWIGMNLPIRVELIEIEPLHSSPSVSLWASPVPGLAAQFNVDVLCLKLIARTGILHLLILILSLLLALLLLLPIPLLLPLLLLIVSGILSSPRFGRNSCFHSLLASSQGNREAIGFGSKSHCKINTKEWGKLGSREEREREREERKKQPPSFSIDQRQRNGIAKSERLVFLLEKPLCLARLLLRAERRSCQQSAKRT